MRIPYTVQSSRISGTATSYETFMHTAAAHTAREEAGLAAAAAAATLARQLIAEDRRVSSLQTVGSGIPADALAAMQRHTGPLGAAAAAGKECAWLDVEAKVADTATQLSIAGFGAPALT